MPPVMPAHAGIHDCVPGMALISEVQVLYGADWPEPLAEAATALQRCRVGRKPEAKLGADEQEPDTRPVRWG